MQNNTDIDLMAYMVQLNPRDMKWDFTNEDYFRIYYIPTNKKITGAVMVDSTQADRYDFILLLFRAENKSINIKDNYVNGPIGEPNIYATKYIHYDPAYTKWINVEINNQDDIVVNIQ